MIQGMWRFVLLCLASGLLFACESREGSAASPPAAPASAGTEQAKAPARAAEPPPDTPSAAVAPEIGELPMALAREVALDGAPSARSDHTAVWTGTEMIVWGGDDAFPTEDTGYAEVPPHPLATGGRYDPAADRWRATSARLAPPARMHHTAVWTGTEMIVWGGFGGARGDAPLADGGRYDPARDRWTRVAMRGIAARAHHTAVWTGREMIVFGGMGASNTFLAEPFAFDPRTGAARPIVATGAPSARALHTAVWTGTEMIVWGGRDARGALGDGARYDPAADRWTPLPAEEAPSERLSHVAVWTGALMIVFGGTGPRLEQLETGAVYDPATNRFRPMTEAHAYGRAGVRGVFASGALVVIGEAEMEDLYPPPNLGVYDPARDAWQSFGASATFGRPLVFTGTDVIGFGGFDGTNMMNDGIRVPVPVTAAPR
jgi:hypothetical protein